MKLNDMEVEPSANLWENCVCNVFFKLSFLKWEALFRLDIKLNIILLADAEFETLRMYRIIHIEFLQHVIVMTIRDFQMQCLYLSFLQHSIQLSK